MTATHQVLWWSRSGRDYSRDRIIRQTFDQLGWTIVDFVPFLSSLGDLHARLARVRTPDLVWVPCFRHRDAAAAARWARSRNVPVVFDPLISAYDKAVFEKEKFPEHSAKAESLRAWESGLMNRFDLVVADTQCHAEFYEHCFRIPAETLTVIPVGAEEPLFHQQPFPDKSSKINVLFYGSFIGLQGPEVIAEAACLNDSVHWTFVGDGPLKSQCQQTCDARPNVTFVPWVPYETLPEIIGNAHILLGVFGRSAKAGRVIPNKVYQSLASGRVVVTQPSKSYPEELRGQSEGNTGLVWVPPGDAQALASAVLRLASNPEQLQPLGAAARSTYLQHFSSAAVRRSLEAVIARVSETQGV